MSAEVLRSTCRYYNGFFFFWLAINRDINRCRKVEKKKKVRWLRISSVLFSSVITNISNSTMCVRDPGRSCLGLLVHVMYSS